MSKETKIYYNIVDNDILAEEDIGPAMIIVDTVIEAVEHYHWAQKQGHGITEMWSTKGHNAFTHLEYQ